MKSFSLTVRVAVTVLVIPPPVAVIVRVYVPGDEELVASIVRVEV